MKNLVPFLGLAGSILAICGVAGMLDGNVYLGLGALFGGIAAISASTAISHGIGPPVW